MRTKFIPKLREYICEHCPMDPEVTNESIDRWEAEQPPRHPIDRAVYEICDKIRKEIDSQ